MGEGGQSQALTEVRQELLDGGVVDDHAANLVDG